jgi:16S rRNA (guanine(966)-N(2))-methyltransferase RsmD
VVLVDHSGAAVSAIRENLALLKGAPGQAQVLRQEALVALAALGDTGVRFDVIYLDPPYASELYEPLLEAVGRFGLLAPGGLVVAEHFHKRALPETMGRLHRSREVRVGDHRLSFYRVAEAGA